MPSTIPYDPSLTLGNIVQKSKLDKVTKIAELLAPVNSAEKSLNSFIALKRSLDMTKQEMIEMDISTDKLDKELEVLKGDIENAAILYTETKINAEKSIQPIRARMSEVNEEIESPIDYVSSQIKKMELSHDSLQLNVQYFSLDQNDQSGRAHTANISSFVKSSLKIFGNYHTTQATAAIQSQVSSQLSTQTLSGTLVISISCTHRDAKMMSPLVLDPDKTVAAWNAVHSSDKINVYSPAAALMGELLMGSSSNPMYILSGATYGSSFVGMVHILKSERTNVDERMESIAGSMQKSLDLGGWFASKTGGFGVNGSFSDNVKNLLSIQNVQSHCTLTTMGIIPSIKSNEIKIGVKQFADFDPASQMDRLAKLQGATASEVNSISSAAAASKTGKQMIELQNATISSTLSGLAEIDDNNNKIIDINSLMTAMDDYIDKCIAAEGSIGVPVNYYLKPITKATVLKSWLKKYYPNIFMESSSSSSDDAEEQMDEE